MKMAKHSRIWKIREFIVVAVLAFGGHYVAVPWEPESSNTGNFSSSYVDGRMTMVGAQVDKFVIKPNRLQFLRS